MPSPKKPPEPLKWSDDTALPCRLLSGICILVGAIHFVVSQGKADLTLVALILLCFIPWLGHIFESFGGEAWGTRYRDRESESIPGQFVTPATAVTPVLVTPPIPSAINPAPSSVIDTNTEPLFSTLSWEEKRVLATLWKYQKIHFPPPKQGQWTFLINSLSSEYVHYARGVLGLGKHTLAGIAQNGHAVLTREGIEYCNRHDPEISQWNDTYDNFSN